MTWSRYKTNTIDEFTLSLETLALEIAKIAEQNSKKYMIGGGWALELTLGKITRNHHDIDFFPLKDDVVWWRNWFESQGLKTKDEQTNEGLIIKVLGNKKETLVDMVPSDLGNVMSVIYKGIKIFIDDPQKILDEKLRNAKEGKPLRRQDLHDISIMGRKLK